MQSTKVNTTKNVRQLVVVGLLAGIIVFLGFSGLGFIQLPIAKITLVHIPVMIGVLIEGPKVGLILAFIFGASSLYQSMVAPTLLSFAIVDPRVSILPRLLIPITCYITYKVIKVKNESLRVGLAAMVGSLTNTIGFLGMIFILYIDKYAEAYNMAISGAKTAIMSIVYTNGIVEAVVSALITSAIVVAVKKVKR